MRYFLIAAFAAVGAGVRAQCVEEELTRSPYCFTATQAAYFCQNNGSTDVGFDQALECLEASIRVRGKLTPDDRDSCLGGAIDDDGPPELVAACAGR